jgi:hypothetical protein
MAVTLTEEEIDLAREAAGERSYAFVEERIAALGDAQRLRLQEMVARWQKVSGKFTRITGGRAGVDVDYGRNRAGIRGQVRLLLELPEKRTLSNGSVGSISVKNEFSF